MNFLWGLLVLLVFSIPGVKGSLLEFGSMIKEVTGKSAFPQYSTYGCYCGLGGQGLARDATDRCCQAHDCCYGKLSDCKTKTDRYQYTNKNGVITCGEGSWCEKQICECDKTAALCFRENLDTYDVKYRFYYNINCKESTMKC
ncbi:basic phospholipase A2-like [Rhineura floridana]|uniref:basic phospholipase A2-like n=1 Tax=Rhineura floridana TaxID=261503 RepID=UPI002AC833E5|nr:basic phospholipase A2-like [Rhineura floridana]